MYFDPVQQVLNVLGIYDTLLRRLLELMFHIEILLSLAFDGALQ